ncbi:aldose 1-epimerase family protein [Acetilactobacillus jinshanensis]|uniref:Aldose 1-epimerase family protein n=1 Tax=Acetilactobacillus jinshanensis TaxID=1720083 RepID=A0A4P6ZJU8_9LACO|nr:aldose 1-epimerase family protein [Acetilactobacillus jinshanensis]QBP18021.1 aldose 1-epimerase family protein [Acetilactobacillus jinshanensis]
MRVTLHNRYLNVVDNTKGAELNSIKGPNQTEYLWQADSDYWGWHAPILFPIVGRLVNNQYRYQGHTYQMHQHGFARQSQFKVDSASDTQVTFELKSSTRTHKLYPFDFDLKVSYKLVAHTVQVQIKVNNVSDKELWFSTGSHPGFNLPLRHDGATFEDYHLTVAPKKVYPRIILKNSLNDVQHPIKADMRTPLNLTHKLFNNDAFVLSLHGHQTTLMLSTFKDNNGVAVTVYNCPYVGVWSPYPKRAPFACIEPWWGLADNYYHHGEFTKKTAINKLSSHQDFTARFDITVF